MDDSWNGRRLTDTKRIYERSLAAASRRRSREWGARDMASFATLPPAGQMLRIPVEALVARHSCGCDIDVAALAHNVRAGRARLRAGCELIAIVKEAS